MHELHFGLSPLLLMFVDFDLGSLITDDGPEVSKLFHCFQFLSIGSYA